MPTTHQHEARKLPDGRIVVRDLPVLAEERETDARFLRERAFRSRLSGKSGPARPRDRKWLQRCLAILNERRAKGYKIPLTFRHSDDNPELAGEVVPTTIRPVALNPGEEPRPTIFADHVFRDRASYDKFKKDFPYRSPELSPDYENEFDALALLSADAPYNKFGVPEIKELFRVSRFYRAKRGVSSNQAWHGQALMRATPSNQSVAATGSALAARGLTDKQEVSRMGADMGIAEAPKADAAGEIDVAPAASTAEMTIGQLGEKLDKLIDMHTKAHTDLMSVMKSMIGGGAKPETQADVPPAEDPVAAEPEHEEDEAGAPSADPAVYRTLKVLRTELSRMRSTREDDAKALASVTGEVLGLRKAQQVLAAEKEHGALVAQAKNRLVALGFDLSADDHAEITKAAKAGKVSVDALVSGYARAAEHAGPGLGVYGTAEADDRLAGGAVEDDMPESVKKLIAKGGEIAVEAKSLYRSWQGMSPKEQERLGGSLDGILFDRDATGKSVMPRAQKARG